MATFFISFGQRFHYDEHSVLGYIPSLPERHVEVIAQDAEQARLIVIRDLGTEWAFMYDEREWADVQTRFPSEGAVATLSMDKPYVKLGDAGGTW